MLFNSLHFLVFFPCVALAHYLLPRRHRWVLLLAASYYFYMSWRVDYVALLLTSTVIDYVAALQMARARTMGVKRAALLLSLGTNLGLLFVFKYFNFFSGVLSDLRGVFGATEDPFVLHVLLPVGISFYTFQTLSYTLDVYRGAREPERHFGYFALYVSFFPQLVAGPIERSVSLLPQLRSPKGHSAERLTSGLRLMAWGFFKKVVIADRLAIYVNEVYGHPGEHGGTTLLLATYFFAFQIFCDFSGYSDIAIGGARVMGYDLMTNFRRPYFSRSIGEFWSRWHISLSTWFRDYVYIPLGGNRTARPRWLANLMTTFLVSGLWHGANWTFVVWGGLHGLFVAAEAAASRAWRRTRDERTYSDASGLLAFARIVTTFHLACLAWIFFRAASVGEAWYIIKTIGTDLQWRDPSIPFVMPGVEIVLVTLLIAGMELVHVVQERGGTGATLDRLPTWIRWPAYWALLMATLFLGVFEGAEFIYFQF